jgi:hypothetical protein
MMREYELLKAFGSSKASRTSSDDQNIDVNLFVGCHGLDSKGRMVARRSKHYAGRIPVSKYSRGQEGKRRPKTLL